MNDFKRRTQNGDARFFGSGGATFASRTTGELEAFFMNIGGTEGTDFAVLAFQFPIQWNSKIAFKKVDSSFGSGV